MKQHEHVADIIVVGAGTAGMRCAIVAKKLENDVILIEKSMEKVWRSSLPVQGGAITFAGSKYQTEQGIEDSPEKFAEDGIKYGGGDPKLWKTMAEHHLEELEFIETELNLMPKDKKVSAASGSFPRAISFEAALLFRRYEAKVKELGIPVYWEHRATELINDPEYGIVGLIADHKGEKLKFKCKKAVILCTGGYGIRKDLIKEFNPDYLADNTMLLMPPTHTGDGLLMALKAGAATKDIKYGMLPSSPTCVYNKVSCTGILNVGAIAVNREGKRFTNEGYHYYGYVSAEGIRQPGGRFYLVYDSKLEEIVKDSPQRPKKFIGNTLEELADSLKINRENFIETIKKYNEDLKKYDRDTVFGRQPIRGKPLLSMDRPPFYGVECGCGITSCKGGIRIDPDSRVLDWENKPIPRLYAAGELVGGFFSAGRYFGPTMVLIAFVTGNIAARVASKERPINHSS